MFNVADDLRLHRAPDVSGVRVAGGALLGQLTALSGVWSPTAAQLVTTTLEEKLLKPLCARARALAWCLCCLSPSLCLLPPSTRVGGAAADNPNHAQDVELVRLDSPLGRDDRRGCRRRVQCAAGRKGGQQGGRDAGPSPSAPRSPTHPRQRGAHARAQTLLRSLLQLHRTAYLALIEDCRK